MGEIKCLENYKRLKSLFEHGDKGSLAHFANKLGVSDRTIYRLINYLREINSLDIKYDRYSDRYYL